MNGPALTEWLEANADRVPAVPPPVAELLQQGRAAEAAGRSRRHRRVIAGAAAMAAALVLAAVVATGGGRLLPAEEAAVGTDHGRADPPPAPHELRVVNRTTETLWLVSWFGNRASVAPGKDITYLTDVLRCADLGPERAETQDGRVVGYLEDLCGTDTWRISSVERHAERGPTGTVTGRARLGSVSAPEPVVFGGVRFSGPVERSVSIGRRSPSFAIDLPPGRYEVTVGNSEHLDCRSVPVDVTVGGVVSVDLSCG